MNAKQNHMSQRVSLAGDGMCVMDAEGDMLDTHTTSRSLLVQRLPLRDQFLQAIARQVVAAARLQLVPRPLAGPDLLVQFVEVV